MDLIEKIAYLYYAENLAQDQIAGELGISQAQVSRHLKKALEQKIVTISIKKPYLAKLERDLCSKLKLKDVRLVFSKKEETFLHYRLGQELARYFQDVTKEGFKVALSGGRTITQFVDALPPRPFGLKLFPLTLWTSGEFVESVNPVILISILYSKFSPKATCLRYELPPVEKYDEVKRYIEHNIRETIKEFATLDMVITGVGDIEDSANPFFHLAKDAHIKASDIRKAGVVGNIFCHAINHDGEKIRTGFEGYFTELLSFDRLKKLTADKTKFVILASGGVRRFKAIKACSKAGLFNVLITDSDTAEELLKS